MSEYLRSVLTSVKGKNAELNYSHVDKLPPEQHDPITNKVTVIREVTVTPEVTVTGEVTGKTITGEVTVTGEVMDEDAALNAGGWIKFNRRIFDLIPVLSGPELKVYLFLLKKSYGANPPKRTCAVTNGMIKTAIGVNAIPPISRTLKSLMNYGLIKRMFTAGMAGEVSIYRVYLPGESKLLPKK